MVQLEDLEEEDLMEICASWRGSAMLSRLRFDTSQVD